MKTKFYWFALFASAALIAQAQAGGNHGGGGGGMGGGNFAGGGRAAPAGGGRAFSSFHSAPMRNFGGNRMIYSSQRFSAAGLRSPSSAAFRQSAVYSNRGERFGVRHFTPGNINRSDRLARTSSEANRAVTSA